MPSPKRRAKVYTGNLSEPERAALVHGLDIPGPYPDLAAVRAAWIAHGAELSAQVRERSAGKLVPWGAVRFDGATGHSSVFCRMGDPTCACRSAARPIASKEKS